MLLLLLPLPDLYPVMLSLNILKSLFLFVFVHGGLVVADDDDDDDDDDDECIEQRSEEDEDLGEEDLDLGERNFVLVLMVKVPVSKAGG